MDDRIVRAYPGGADHCDGRPAEQQVIGQREVEKACVFHRALSGMNEA